MATFLFGLFMFLLAIVLPAVTLLAWRDYRRLRELIRAYKRDYGDRPE